MHAHYDATDLNLSIDPKVLKPLFAIQKYRHALALLYNWAIIVTVAGLCLAYFSTGLYLFTLLIVGARMHALAILMHDATHFRFLKNRKWNDLITNFVTAYPLFTSIATYRENHLRHHQHLNTEDDPDWVAKLGKRAFCFPKTKGAFLLTIFSYFLLLQGIRDAVWFFRRFAGSKKDTRTKENPKPRILFFVLLLLLLTLGGFWKQFLLFWIVPYFSTFFMFQYIRSVAEHFGALSYDHLLSSTRTIKVNMLEQFFLAPHNVGYHLEHHLYPGVPFYHLPRLHNLLMAQAAYRQKAHITYGYFRGLMNELGGLQGNERVTHA